MRLLVWTLTGASVFVLLIACANVAGFLIGRAHARRGELALRAALGCSHARLVRQLLTESLLLGVTGGAIGFVLTMWSVAAFTAMAPAYYLPRMSHIGVDTSVLVVCLGASILTSLVFGVWPAVHASRADPLGAMKTMGGTPSRLGRRARGGLVVVEVALALALSVGAGLLVKTFLHLRPDQPGFDPAGKMEVAVPRSDKYPTVEAQRAFNDELLRRLSSGPGIVALATASFLPLSGFANTAHIAAGGSTAAMSAFFPVVSPNYFKEMGIPLIRGRAFGASDDAGAPRVAVLGERLAASLFPNADPIGRVVDLAPDDTIGARGAALVVGVAGDVRMFGNSVVPRRMVYTPAAQFPGYPTVIVMRTAMPVERASALVHSEVAAIDGRLVVGPVESMPALVAQQVTTWRMSAVLMSTLAGIAVGLAALGLIAIVSWSVAERSKEIAIRAALGASRRGLLLAGTGAAIGLALAGATTRYLQSSMVDVRPLDPATFASACAGLLAIAWIASYAPARRTLKVDPIAVLKDN